MKPIVAPALLSALLGTVRINVVVSYVHAKVPDRVNVPVQVGDVKWWIFVVEYGFQ